jgi:hypothetical protein
MKPSWIVIAFAALVVTAGPALARGKYKRPPQCVDQFVEFSWQNFLLGLNPEPRPNGCAPPVYSDGNFVGQDPDAFIRHGLRVDPSTGYEYGNNY